MGMDLEKTKAAIEVAAEIMFSEKRTTTTDDLDRWDKALGMNTNYMDRYAMHRDAAKEIIVSLLLRAAELTAEAK